jgi:hypothetical protein
MSAKERLASLNCKGLAIICRAWASKDLTWTFRFLPSVVNAFAQTIAMEKPTAKRKLGMMVSA